MNRRKSIKTILYTSAASMIFNKRLLAGTALTSADEKFDAYLMAHFKEDDQKLYYAYSIDAKNWTA